MANKQNPKNDIFDRNQKFPLQKRKDIIKLTNVLNKLHMRSSFNCLLNQQILLDNDWHICLK